MHFILLLFVLASGKVVQSWSCTLKGIHFRVSYDACAFATLLLIFLYNAANNVFILFLLYMIGVGSSMTENKENGDCALVTY